MAGRSAAQKASEPRKTNFVWLAVAVLVLAGLLVYSNAYKGGFLWDDEYLVKENAYLKAGPAVFRFLYQDIGAGADKEYSSYRPVQMLSYGVDYLFWKLKPAGYHFGSILTHIASALAFCWLVFLIFGDRRLALLASLFFVAHPVHTEAVTYISGRADPLAALFAFLAFSFYLKTLKRGEGGSYILMGVSYLLALLSKEHSVILPLLILVYHYAFSKRINTRSFATLAAMALGYLVLRMTVLSALLFKGIGTSTFPQRIPGSFVAIFNYMRLLIAPWPLHMEYGEKIFPWTEPRCWLGIFALIAINLHVDNKAIS